jgi:hypothetical protein
LYTASQVVINSAGEKTCAILRVLKKSATPLPFVNIKRRVLLQIR